jgi:hypothetical protein
VVRVLRVVAIVALSGCDVVFGLSRSAPPPDAAIDAPLDTRPCFGSGPVVVCLLALPTMPLVIDIDQALDTSSLCPAYDDPVQPYCVLAGTDITISKRMRATGSKPLVLVATNLIEISGELDASSKRGSARGPGAEPAGCVAITPTAAGGGPGGTHGGRGGAGGAGAGAVTPSALVRPPAFEPGCAGTQGARSAGGQGGAGGAGGGAVFLIAPMIRIDGTLNASGAGGSGGTSTGTTVVGGGGGGAGGTLALDAPTVQFGVMARVFANGGGGGEGAAGAPGTGAPGADPTATTAGTRAAGGTGIYTIEGDGGGGSVGANLDGLGGGGGTNAGGGGGGGAGTIWILTTPIIEVGAIVSPAPTAAPP